MTPRTIGAVWVGAGVKGIHVDAAMEKIIIPALASPALASPVIAGVVAMTATYLGFALSTTQVCSGGILGAGLGPTGST